MTEPTNDAATQARTSKRAVLVVDDERRIADTLAIILNAKGYPTTAAYDGAAALQSCRECPPDLVITDVVMPGMNGIDLAIAVRQLLSGCHVLLFSGQAATADLLDEARVRGHEFTLLAKPLHPEALLREVERLIGAGGSLSSGTAA